MSTTPHISTLVLSLVFFVAGCSTPPSRIHSDDVPVGSLRVAEVVVIAQRSQILGLEVHKAIIAAGVSDADLVDGSVVGARIYCCGGPTKEASAEHANRRVLYVPTGLKVRVGDFVEVKVGRPPEKGDGGRLNTVTRVVAKSGDQPERCWWDPRNDKLWLRTPYCEWMQNEGWVKQGGVSPAWFKPVVP